MLKPNEICLRWKQITIISEKNFATDEKYILRKMSWKFENPKFSISNKIGFFIFFVIKCETFGVKRSIRAFWNK